MAVLVIDDVVCADDVLALARHLLDCLAHDEIGSLVAPGTVRITKGSNGISDAELEDLVALDEVDHRCTDPHHRPGCSCRHDAAHTDPRQLRTADPDRHEGPVPYLPCPTQGLHLSLTECWMCWSDVHRGALAREETLAF